MISRLHVDDVAAPDGRQHTTAERAKPDGLAAGEQSSEEVDGTGRAVRVQRDGAIVKLARATGALSSSRYTSAHQPP